MLKVFLGNNRINVITRAEADIARLKKGNTTARVVVIDADMPISDVQSVIETDSLFGERAIVFIKYPKESESLWSFIIEHVADMQKSHEAFFIVEKQLLAGEKKYLPPGAEIVTVSQKELVEDHGRNDIFALAQAIARKDRKRAWQLYVTVRQMGVSAEELFPLIFWQARVVAAALRAKTAAEADIKPFVFSSARSIATGYRVPEKESRTQLLDILRIYHQARLSGHDGETELERYILEL